MIRDRHLLRLLALAALLAVCVLAAWLGLVGWLLVAGLGAAERAAVADTLAERLPAVALLVVLGAAAVTAGVHWCWQRQVAAPARLLEQARVLLNTDAPARLPEDGPPGLGGLAAAFNTLAGQREALRDEMASRVAAAAQGIEQERSRLAALMAELSHSVVVCNPEGRVLLYNQHARQQFGTELVGLGRSIHGVLDAALLAHALARLQQRCAAENHPVARFASLTRAGRLLQVQMAAVREAGVFSGYVLMIDDVTARAEQDTAQDGLLHALTEGSRASQGNLQAAVELLASPDLDAATRERFLTVVRDEAQAMSARLNDVAARSAQAARTRWPLEDMHGAELLAAAQRRIEAEVGAHAGLLEVDPQLWLRVDSYALLLALVHLARRLAEGFELPAVQLRLQRAGAGAAARAQLDLVWPNLPVSTETVMAWETDPLLPDGVLCLRDVVQRHDGEFWFERGRAQQQQFFRFLLPLADEPLPTEALPTATEARPGDYDFDLFAHSESQRALDEQPLAALRYTVFDTETTGLAPQQGDEIIQLGAVRLVNGRLLRGECLDQLVDPQRSIPAAGIPIHGITPAMVQGQPTLAQVLPAFHAFAADTVLVAHNAAFDMRFLQLQEAATGLRFDQPVLDTLLLSALVHPQQDSHRLEAIAERLGVSVTGRHTALGDALTTAEVFLKLLPLLAAQGIHTLGEARRAAQQTYYARLQY